MEVLVECKNNSSCSKKCVAFVCRIKMIPSSLNLDFTSWRDSIGLCLVDFVAPR